jgi:hypothetical protein
VVPEEPEGARMWAGQTLGMDNHLNVIADATRGGRDPCSAVGRIQATNHPFFGSRRRAFATARNEGCL